MYETPLDPFIVSLCLQEMIGFNYLQSNTKAKRPVKCQAIDGPKSITIFYLLCWMDKLITHTLGETIMTLCMICGLSC